MIARSRTGSSVFAVALAFVACVGLSAGAQTPGAARNSSPAVPEQPPVVVPADYVVGPEDVLTVFFWREKDLSGDAVVRPDGRLSLPLLNEIEAAGLTPEQLRERITESATKFLTDPTVTVVVKQINSRKVFITGNISKPGPYPLGGPTSVMQLIATAGGIAEFADGENIQVLRTESGKQRPIRFNYNDVKRGKNLQQNILLKPGDTIIVP